MNDSAKRVTAALSHQEPDRVPRDDGYWAEFTAMWREEKGIDKDVDIHEYYENDIRVAVGNETPYYSQAKTLEEGEGYKIERDGWGMVKRVTQGGKFYEELGVAIEEPADLDRKPFDPATDDARYDKLTPAVERWKETDFVFCKTGGPYLRTAFLRGQTQFLMDIAADPVFVKEIVSRTTDHLIAIAREELRRWGLYSTGLAIYDDMAYNDSLMFSPRTYEDIFQPAIKRMVQAAKDAGARFVMFHSDGNIADALDGLIDAGVDAINPVEPRAGLDVVKLKEKYGTKLAFVGGLCNSLILPKGTPDEVRAHAEYCLRAAEGGGYVMGCHSVGPDIPVRNYDITFDVWKEFVAGR